MSNCILAITAARTQENSNTPLILITPSFSLSLSLIIIFLLSLKLTMNIFLSLSLLIISINLTLVSSHFFPNISSIPPSFFPNNSVWDSFNNFVGCRKGQSSDGLSNLKKYFRRFGYLNASEADSSDVFDSRLESAVKAYQLNFNLDPTGELDAPTLRHIVLPRCGCPDFVGGVSSMNADAVGGAASIHAVAHYSFFPNRPRWPPSKRNLTYAFLPENGLSAAVRAAFERAFARWAEVTPLTFRETAAYGRADIRVGFFTRDHGDGEEFDGVLGTLAHAFSPTNGRLHLDGEESWVVDGEPMNGSTRFAVDLESVAVHEIGHVLGLGHSSVEEAIMYPTISSGQRKVRLANDDVMGVQELYGSNPNYNGSTGFSPTGARETSGAPRVDRFLFGVGTMLTWSLLLLSFT